jgi:two-component system alkaline phosphatase synthesis response regulator PhoP
MRTIYILEDDDNIRELVAYALKSAGFAAAEFAESAAFSKALREQLPDLVLLDIMLPGKDGIEILRELRQKSNWAKLPVIMMTAKGAEYDRIRGLDLGADDYITKPFSVMELVADYHVGALTLSDEKRTVTVNGEGVPLTYKEFELLRYLFQNAVIVLDRDRILNAVWGYEYDGENRTVDMHIKTLRQKLGDGGASIKTVRGVGYKIEEIT